MLSTVIFYTALLTTVLPIKGLQDTQLDAVVKLLDSHINAKSASSSGESSESDDDTVGKRLKTMDVIKLIQQASKNKKTVHNYNDKQEFRTNANAFNQFYQNRQYDYNGNDRDNYRIKNLIAEKILKEERNPKNRYHQRLNPNRLLSPNQYQFENEDRKPKGGLNEYTKIFVILDPIALKKSRNTENLPNLLSRILAQASSAVNKPRQDSNNSQRYKGFVVKNSSKSRRYRRESKEMYAGGDDDDYRPKRSRNEHNGGGGGGRTAIPYIRHRGDIYEKDH